MGKTANNRVIGRLRSVMEKSAGRVKKVVHTCRKKNIYDILNIKRSTKIFIFTNKAHLTSLCHTCTFTGLSSSKIGMDISPGLTAGR